jgi:iron complex outermembrane recepter protein
MLPRMNRPAFRPIEAAAALMLLSIAHGESARAETDGGGRAELPTITVTPDWRPADAQRVPKTIEHFSGAELDAAGVHHTIDLQYLATGFIFKTNSVLGQPYLRGVGTDIISAGAESSVATFIDGAYMPRAYDTIVDFFDVERVEVIKGPQAVHLGRNVVGGAVSIHTRDPGDERGGYADVQLGNFAQRRVRAAADLPFDRAPLALRFAASAAKRDGYVENVFLGIDENDEDYRAWRVKLRYEPSDNVTLVFGSERHDEDSSRALGSQPAVGVGVSGGISLGGTVPTHPRQVTENVPPMIDVSSTRHGARMTWVREGWQLRSTTTFLATDAALALDLDGTNADYAANYPTGRTRSFAQEVRFESATSGPLSWTGGIFVLDEDAGQILDTRVPANGTRSFPDARVATGSRAAFGEAAHAFGRWRARAGARWNRDERRIDLVRTVTSPAGTTITEQHERRTWAAVTPELGLEYSPADGRLYYLSAARGHKPGGFNTSAVQPPFDSERLDAYEAGIKTTIAGGRMRLNAALFRYDYRNMQLDTPPSDPLIGTFPMVINAAESSITGLDVEIVLLALRSGSLVSIGAAFLDAEFDDFMSRDPNNPGVDPNRAGNRLPHAPRTSANLRFEHSWTFGRGELAVVAEYRHQSKVSFSIYADPALEQAAYGLLNSAVMYSGAGRRWYAELYARNLTDKLYAQTILRRDPLTGTKRFWGAPRTAGLRLGYRW